MSQKVNILGTEYRMEFQCVAENPYLKDANGYVDRTTKKIVIGKREHDCEIEDFEAFQRKVIRHEIVHAYLEESGLSTNVENPPLGVPETYVDWFAIQAPKIYRTYAELGVLDASQTTESIQPKNCKGCFGAADNSCQKCDTERPQSNTSIPDLTDLAGTIALAHGMDGKTSPAEFVALIHAEVSEVLEEFRSGHKATETYYAEDGKPEGVPSELADAVIYCFIMADLNRIDLEKAITEKLEYNKKRPYKHGKEF